MKMTLPPMPAIYAGKPDKPGAPLFDGYGDHTHKITTDESQDAGLFRSGRAPAVRLQSCRGDPLLPRSRAARSRLRDVLVGRRLRARPQHQSADAARCGRAGLGRRSRWRARSNRKPRPRKSRGSRRSPRATRKTRQPTAIRSTKPSRRRWARSGIPIPNDLDAGVFYAEAMMDTQPWDYWQSDAQDAERPRRGNRRDARRHSQERTAPSRRAASLHPRGRGLHDAGARGSCRRQARTADAGGRPCRAHAVAHLLPRRPLCGCGEGQHARGRRRMRTTSPPARRRASIPSPTIPTTSTSCGRRRR